jgi:hypothetical protein
MWRQEKPIPAIQLVGKTPHMCEVGLFAAE